MRITRDKRACLACGRKVAVKSVLQNKGGGKGRVRHLCPHGVLCVTGVGPHYGEGHNRPPPVGPNACKECARRLLATSERQSGGYEWAHQRSS